MVTKEGPLLMGFLSPKDMAHSWESLPVPGPLSPTPTTASRARRVAIHRLGTKGGEAQKRERKCFFDFARVPAPCLLLLFSLKSGLGSSKSLYPRDP